jgi:hypothetical protein
VGWTGPNFDYCFIDTPKHLEKGCQNMSYYYVAPLSTVNRLISIEHKILRIQYGNTVQVVYLRRSGHILFSVNVVN